jgi:hypothetical protein
MKGLSPMKHIPTLLMTVLLSTSASAADAVATPGAPEGRRTVLGILINPNQLGVLALQGERVVGPRVSVGLGVRAGLLRAGDRSEAANDDIPSFNSETENASYLVGAGARARFFLTGTAPEGLWLSPQLDLARRWGHSDIRSLPVAGWESQMTLRAWSVGGTALVGYSTVVGKGLAVQVGAGVETRYERGRTSSSSRQVSETGELSSSEFSGRVRSWSVNERVELSLGWVF